MHDNKVMEKYFPYLYQINRYKSQIFLKQKFSSEKDLKRPLIKVHDILSNFSEISVLIQYNNILKSN